MPRRHSLNNAAGAFFTHFEKQQLKGTYGTIKQRLNRDALKPFDACSLCLCPVVLPVADRQGNIYCKQCILQYLLDHKKMLKLKKKEYKQQLLAYEASQKSLQKEHQEAISSNFTKRENQITSTTDSSSKSSNYNMNHAFWLPANTPSAKESLPPKPTKVVESPFGYPIHQKDLVTLNLTTIPSEFSTKSSGEFDKEKNESVQQNLEFGKYMCPICTKSLNQTVEIQVIIPVGTVLCKGCMDSLVRKTMVCPVTITSFTDEDVLALQSQSTPYAGRTGSKLEAKVKTPAPRF